METDIDDYLKSNDALHQTESAQGHLLHPDETIGGFRVVAFLGRGATGEETAVNSLPPIPLPKGGGVCLFR